MTKWSKKLYIL